MHPNKGSEDTMSKSRENQSYNEVKSAFVAKGDSLSAWCRRNGITRVYAVACLKGERNGPRARSLADLVRRAADTPHENA